MYPARAKVVHSSHVPLRCLFPRRRELQHAEGAGRKLIPPRPYSFFSCRHAYLHHSSQHGLQPGGLLYHHGTQHSDSPLSTWPRRLLPRVTLPSSSFSTSTILPCPWMVIYTSLGRQHSLCLTSNQHQPDRSTGEFSRDLMSPPANLYYLFQPASPLSTVTTLRLWAVPCANRPGPHGDRLYHLGFP